MSTGQQSFAFPGPLVWNCCHQLCSATVCHSERSKGGQTSLQLWTMTNTIRRC